MSQPRTGRRARAGPDHRPVRLRPRRDHGLRRARHRRRRAPERQPEPVERARRGRPRRSVASAGRCIERQRDRGRLRQPELPGRAAAGYLGRLPLRHRQLRRRAAHVRRARGLRSGRATAPWTCNSTICQSPCVPAEGDTCNTVVMEGDVTVPYRFGSALGLGSGTSQRSCRPPARVPCGCKPVPPVDVVLVVDRTQSMNGIDTANARAAANSLRNPTTRRCSGWASGARTRAMAVPACRPPTSSRHRQPRHRRAALDTEGVTALGRPGRTSIHGGDGTQSPGQWPASPIRARERISADPVPWRPGSCAHNGRPGSTRGSS